MATTFEGTLDEIFNGSCAKTKAHLDEWCSDGGGTNTIRCVLTALVYCAWKLSEIERRLAGRP